MLKVLIETFFKVFWDYYSLVFYWSLKFTQKTNNSNGKAHPGNIFNCVLSFI